MATYILLTRHRSALNETDEALSVMSERLIRKVGAACAGVTWKEGFAVLGPYDYLDIFEAPDAEAAARVAFMVRTNADVETEIWAATTRDAFERIIGEFETGGRDTAGGSERSSSEDVDEIEEADRESFPASDPPSYTGTSST